MQQVANGFSWLALLTGVPLVSWAVLICALATASALLRRANPAAS